MEIVLSLAIGVLAGSGIWLLLRPRTFQVIMGLSLVSYAVNLFIFSMGRITLGAPPVIKTDWLADPSQYADPLPRSEAHTSELQSLMRNSYAVFCLKKKQTTKNKEHLQLH